MTSHFLEHLALGRTRWNDKALIQLTGVIRELKRHYRRVMTETGAPEVLWDYCLEWCAHVRSNLAPNIRKLDGQTPATMMTGDTVDISHIAEFGWYDWVWYMDIEGKPGQEATQQRSMQRKRLGRYLGPSHNVGGAMCGMVMTDEKYLILLG